MTISTETRSAGPFAGNGTTTEFAFTFKVFAASEVVITRKTVATDDEETLTQGSNLVVTLNADQDDDPGGTVTYTPDGVPMSSAYTLTIASDVEATQTVNIVNNDGFYPRLITRALDKLTILIQQLLSRALMIPAGDSASGNMTLPSDRALKYLAFDTDKQPIAAEGTGTTTDAQLLNYLAPSTGAISRKQSDVNDDERSIFDFTTRTLEGIIKDRLGTDDVNEEFETAFAACIEEGRKLKLPGGLYLFADTAREATNGGMIQLLGEGRFNSVIKSVSGMTSKPLIWLGNSTGHNAYQARVAHIGFDGRAKSDANILLRLHEGSLSQVEDCAFANANIPVQGLGLIHGYITKNYFSTCTYGVILTRTAFGTPANADDITLTASPVSLSPNTSGIEDNWFTAIDREIIRVEGGITKVRGNVSQSCGTSASYDLVTLSEANEAYDYGGGPMVELNWFEGGTYRYAIAARTTRAASIIRNFISGSESADGTKEGGILVKGSENCTVKYNSLRGYFTATATESRAKSAYIYVHSDCGQNGVYSPNYMTKNTPSGNFVAQYFAGESGPIYAKTRTVQASAYVTITAGVPTIENGMGISSITKNGTGDFSITLASNREIGKCASHLTPESGGGGVCYSASRIAFHAVGYDRYLIWSNNAGALADPYGFSYTTLGEGAIL